MTPDWRSTNGLQKRRPVFGAEDGVWGGDRGVRRGAQHDLGQLIHPYYRREIGLSTAQACLDRDDGLACLRLR